MNSNSNQEAALQGFISDEENTMNSYTAASVYVLLEKLATNKKLSQEQANSYINGFTVALQKYQHELEIDDEELAKILTVIEKRLAENIDQYDTAGYYEAYEIMPGHIFYRFKELALTLKTVFALVCRAMFSPNDPYGVDDKVWQDGLADRVKVLYLCWEKISEEDSRADSHNICHQGVRHMLALTLYKFNPLADDLIIMNLDCFLEMKAAEFLVMLFNFKKPLEQFKCIIDIIQKKLVFNSEDLQLREEALKVYLYQVCGQRGMNMNATVGRGGSTDNKIAIKNAINNALQRKDFFETIPEIALHVHHLRSLQQLSNNFDTHDQITKQAVIKQADIMLVKCQTFTDLRDNGLVTLIEVNEIEKYLRTFLFIASYYQQDPDEQQFNQEVEDIIAKIISYYADFASGKISNTAPFTQKQQLGFKTRIEKFKAENSINDITSFFALFNNAIYDPRVRFELVQAIAAKQQSILLDDNEYLIQELLQNREAAIVSFCPYQVNRILLHAILCPLIEWSENFSSCFALVLNFLKQSPPGNSTTSDSQLTVYPAELLNVLEALDLKHGDIKNINTIPALSLLLQLLPEQNQLLILEHIKQNGCLSRIIGNIADFVCLIRYLPEQNQLSCMQQLGGGVYIKPMISTAEDLADLVRYLPEQTQLVLMQQLGGIAYVKTMIKDMTDLGQLIGYLPEQKQFEFIKQLGGNDYIKSMINTAADLGGLVKYSPEQNRLAIIQQLGGSAYVQTIVKNAPDLGWLIRYLPAQEQLPFIQQLDSSACVKIMIKEMSDLSWLIRYLAEPNRLAFIQYLGGGDYIKQMSMGSFFCELLTYLPKQDQSTLVKSMINTVADLCRLVKYLPESNRLAFIQQLGGSDYIKQIGMDGLDDLFASLPTRDQLKLKQELDQEVVQNILK